MPNRIFISFYDGVENFINESVIEKFIYKVMGKMDFDFQEISILFCKDDYMQMLNKTYRKIDAPTDVLSFECGDEYSDDEGKWKNVGDIAISIDTLKRNAEYFEVEVNTELKRLLIHGILHLNGFDHGEEHLQKNKPPECIMLKIQEELLLEFSADKLL